MSVIYCPNCDQPLPGFANYCGFCGESLTSPGHKSIHFLAGQAQPHMLHEQDETIDLDAPSTSDNDITNDLTTSTSHLAESGTTATTAARSETAHGARRPGGVKTVPLNYDEPGENGDGIRSVVPVTWYKEVERISDHTKAVYPPRPVPSSRAVVPYTPRRSMAPTLVLWTSLILMVALVLGGFFGVIVTFGRGVLGIPQDTGELTLQVTPEVQSINYLITLDGNHFSQRGRVGLTRDNAIPVVDVNGNSVIVAGANGQFHDQVIIPDEWGIGAHTLNAEDAVTHRIASFPIQVTGQGTSLRPAHLALSLETLDMGAGDPATPTTKLIRLLDDGGGQISWKASADQPWLSISPKNGTFASGQTDEVRIAANRTGMKPGSYHAQVTFSSDAGNETLSIKMQVTPLLPAHQAVLQVAPTLLSFKGTDGGGTLPAQALTISNPGVSPLSWSAFSNANWLSVSPRFDSIAAGGSESVLVTVDTSTLMPGTYSGVITFGSQNGEAVKNAPQNVYVNLSVTPRCTLQASPTRLTFTATHPGPAPAAQQVNLGLSQSCKAAIPWSASSNASWLSISAKSGTTPASPSIIADPSALSPGTYHGAITINSSAGTQTLSVTFTIGLLTTPMMAATPGGLTFTAVSGQGNPGAQTVTLTNTGGGNLAWSAGAATAVGGSWLSVTPAAGNVAAGKSVTLSVTVAQNNLPANTYNGTITITGTDGAGHAAGGSPRTIGVTFVIKSACGVSTSPPSLNFTGQPGQPPAAQAISVTPGGSCANALNWTASLASSGWLNADRTAGNATVGSGGVINVSASPNGLAPGTYHGSVTITATDSVTHATIGSPMTVPVTLVVQPSCTLQTPSPASVNFPQTAAGSNPDPIKFTVSVSGTCTGNVTLSTSLNANWVSVSPTTATVQAGGSMTFTVSAQAASLAPNDYAGTISLFATNGGAAIAGSPQPVGVTLTVVGAAAVSASPQAAQINVSATAPNNPVTTITNSGGAALRWTATLDNKNAPFVSLPASGGTLAGGANKTIFVNVDANSAHGGQPYSASLTVSAVDTATGKAVRGSPITVPITINVAAAQMQMDRTVVSFVGSAANPPAPKAVTLTNAGGGMMTWRVGTPSQSWLSVSPASGSRSAQGSTTLTFTANTKGLTPNTTYNAQVVVTSSAGDSVTIHVTLYVSAPAASGAAMLASSTPSSDAGDPTPLPSPH